MDQGFLRELFLTNDTKVRGIRPAREGHVGRNHATNLLDKRRREPGTGLAPDKKARSTDLYGQYRVHSGPFSEDRQVGC